MGKAYGFFGNPKRYGSSGSRGYHVQDWLMCSSLHGRKNWVEDLSRS